MARFVKMRIAVIGNIAGGKTTLSLELGEALGLPVITLDNYLWEEEGGRGPLPRGINFDQDSNALSPKD